MRERRWIRWVAVMLAAIFLIALADRQKNALKEAQAPQVWAFAGTSAGTRSKWTGFLQSLGADPNGPWALLQALLPGFRVQEEALPVTSYPEGEDIGEEDEGPQNTPVATSNIHFTLSETPLPAENLPTVLVYHTHTHEAYNPLDGKAYTETTGKWRTTDTEKNIVKVGSVLCDLLRKEGFTVYHDQSDYEPPSLDGAYDRSLAGVTEFLTEHPEVTVFIDVHRDAYSESRPVSVEVDGKSCAQIMFVVGSGEGTGFTDLPDVEKNTVLAQNVMDALRLYSSDLVRRMSCKTGRYNQHLSDSCMLIEVGHNINTLEEALNSLPYLAKALRLVLSTLEVPG